MDAGHDDGQFHLARGIELFRRCGLSFLERLISLAQCALAVHDERQMLLRTGNTAMGPEFFERQGVILGGIGCHTRCFTHHRNSAGLTYGRVGVLERELGVDVQIASRHHKVLGHPLSITRFQRLELTTSGLVDLATRHVLVDVRCDEARLIQIIEIASSHPLFAVSIPAAVIATEVAPTPIIAAPIGTVVPAEVLPTVGPATTVITAIPAAVVTTPTG